MIDGFYLFFFQTNIPMEIAIIPKMVKKEFKRLILNYLIVTKRKYSKW
jgi:hypothetical protein